MNKIKIHNIRIYNHIKSIFIYIILFSNTYYSAVWGQSSMPCPGCTELNFQRFASRPNSPDEPFNYQVPSSQSDWNSYNSTQIRGQTIGQVSVQESDVLRLEVRKEYGGAIQIYDKITKQNLINFYDKGRESGMGTYSGPDSFSDDAPFWRTGYNPLQAGDAGENPPKMLFHGFVNGYIYTKIQANSWSHVDNRLLPFYYEQWAKLDGNKVSIKVRLTHQRPDKTFYRAYQQEWPFMMINGAKFVRFYNGSSPFTMAPSSASNGIERKLGDNTYLAPPLPAFQVTEPWVATEIGANTDGSMRMIGLTGPEFYHVSYNVSVLQSESNSEDGNTITYWGHHPLVHIDSDNTWYKEYTYVVGNESDIRSYAYEKYPHVTKPDFHFAKANGRNGWYIQDGGHDQKEPFQVDNWTVTFDGKADPGQPINARGTKLASPYGSWKASDCSTIYIRMRYSGPENQLRIGWLIDGQAPDGVDSNFPNLNSIRFPRGVRDQAAQSIPLKIINDGQMHTYQVNFNGNPNWQGIIQQFELAHSFDGPVIPPGEVLEMAYFGVNNPDNQ